MAEGIKISELPEVETLQDGCCFPIISEVDGVMQNVKIKKLNLEKNLASELYSEEEETVVGKWIDGKPIYRRIEYATRLFLNIDNTGSWINTVDSLTGGYAKIFSRHSNGSTREDLFPIYKTSGVAIGTTFVLATSYTFIKVMFIMEYTKTTD